MEGLKRVLREEPTIIAAAIRQTLLAAVLLGLRLDEAQVVGIMIAVESILTMFNRSMVTPVAKVEEAVADAKVTGRAEAIVERAMSPTLTDDQLQAELDRIELAVQARKEG